MVLGRGAMGASIKKTRRARARALVCGCAIAIVVALPLFGEAPVAAAQETIWTRQFGTAALDVAAGIALDASANAYVAGTTNGALETSSGSSDVFVRKYDVSGN